MSSKQERGRDRGHGDHAHGRGPSSFWMHDPEAIFDELGLVEGDCFLDLGCGPGDYALRASGMVDEIGTVYALDSQAEMIDALAEKSAAQGTENIKALVADITRTLPVEDNCIDVCFIATVLHALDFDREGPGLFEEVHRVLKPGGRLAIIECKKEYMPFGPPLNMRLSPEEIESLATRCGFEKEGLSDLGYNYMLRFVAV